MGVLGKLLDQKTVAEYPQGLDLIMATRYGVTVYPIVFAALVGNFLQSAAAWLLEKGATIMVMEQLLGSQALFGAIRTQFMLNHWNLKEILIVLLWALSPLGGQGTLRLISVTNRPIQVISPVWYMRSDSPVLEQPYWATSFSATIDPMNSVYTSSLIAPNETQSGAQDTWGNIKIPRIESLSNSTLTAGVWYPIPDVDVIYTSLVGIPIKAVPREANSTFIIQASYFNLNCPDGPQWVAKEDGIVWDRDAFFNTSSGNPLLTGHIESTNATVRGVGARRFYRDKSIRATFSIGTFGPFTNNSKYEALDIILQSYTATPSSDRRSITMLICTFAITNVDCAIKCNGEKCKVTSMSLTPSKDYPDYKTSLAVGLVSMQFFDNLVVAAGYYNTLGKYTTNTLSEQYMRYGSSPLAYEDRGIQLNISLVPAKQLEERFMRVLNSYWIPALDPQNMVGVPATAEMLAVNSSTNAYGRFAKTSAQVVTLEEIYVCSQLWLIILLVSSFTLFACLLVGLGLKYFTRGLEILGHFSTLARDNPLIRVPPGGSTLDGFQRARVLKDLKVRLGDSNGYEQVGHVAISSFEGCGNESSHISFQKGRFYD